MASSASNESKSSIREYFRINRVKGVTALKYRKGACSNCGAMSHTKKECTERPRRKGAKWTNSDIQPDEYVEIKESSFEGKRDRWNGFGKEEYQEAVKRLEIEQKRREQEKEELKELQEMDSDDSDYEQGTAAESIDQSTTGAVQNMRIREDTAKYLENWKEDDEAYDPKSRSMRKTIDGLGVKDLASAGDDFVRTVGHSKDEKKLEAFAWETSSRREMLTSAAFKMGEDKKNRKKAKESSEFDKKVLVAKYGGEEHLKAPFSKLIEQSERNQEFDGLDEINTAEEIGIPSSKYPEDICDGNHRAIWGSFYAKGNWGYNCCHQV